MKIKIIFAFMILTVWSNHCFGQTETCGAENFFETNPGCLGSNRGSKCLQLDVSHSLDEEGKEFVYSWNFGDGNKKEGLLTEYCFEAYGTYFITLDLVDAVTKMVIRNELSTTITLFPPATYQVDTLTQTVANFEYNKNEFPGFSARDIFWKIDGNYYCGPMSRHDFAREGFHLIEIGMTGSSEEMTYQIGCTLMGIFIKPPEQ